MWYMGMMRKLRHDLYDDFGFKEGDAIEEHDLHTPSASGRVLETLTPMEKWLLLTQGEIRGELIYEAKPNNSIYHFPVAWDEGAFKGVKLWFEQVKWHVDNKQMPKVTNLPSKFPCSWRGGKCQFYEKCWGNGRSGQAESTD
jgi:hypothetical protein